MQPKITVGQRYRDNDGDMIEITGQLYNGHYIGSVVELSGRLDPTSYAYTATGERPEGWAAYHSALIVGKVGHREFRALQPYEQITVRDIVKAFNTKKITGIKVLRSIHKWGLLEAKNIFEDVAAGIL